MIVDRGLNNFHFIPITEFPYLVSLKEFCWIQTSGTRYSMIFNKRVQKFYFLGPFGLLNIQAVGILEKRSIAARKYISCHFSSQIGPTISNFISWFGSAHCIWERNCLAGITDLRFLPIAEQVLYSLDLTIISPFMYGYQQCVAIHTIPHVPGWLAWGSLDLVLQLFVYTDATGTHM